MDSNILKSLRQGDFIEYYLFPKEISNDKNKNDESALQRLQEECNDFIKKYLNGYLWHKDSFKLTVRTGINNYMNSVNGAEALPSHLYGCSDCGDNLDDEWFIVFLLIELTKQIDGLVVRVFDVDGEFLLIEAADYLPNWANPETCDKRVYLHKGLVHIIAPSEEEEEEEEAITVNEAIKEIRNNPALTVASVQIQDCIKNKIKEYPGAINANFHYAKAYLPVAVAAILENNPNLVSPAIQAFCNRDTIDMKACRAMKYFPPEDRVNVRVKFTKHLYAMLTHSKFIPDRKIGWNLPPVNSPSHKSHLLGIKIACGFEILAAQAKPNGLDNDRAWIMYFDKLKSTNYFKGLLEHSKEYNELLNKAKDHFANNREDFPSPQTVGQEILSLVKNLDYSNEDFKKKESGLPEDDDESWLNISPEELEKMLQEKYGKEKLFNFNSNSDAVNFTEKVNSFLEHVSGIEGAEFPSTTEPPVRPPRTGKNKSSSKVTFTSETKSQDKDEDSNQQQQQQGGNKINFDPNLFSCAVQNILNLVIPEDDNWGDSDSDMSDYGAEEEADLDIKKKMEEYIKEMDRELASTTIGESFVQTSGATSGEDKFEDVENFLPVDIDKNALKNILESYRSQLGEAGPSSNMLGPMGVHLETSMDDEEMK